MYLPRQFDHSGDAPRVDALLRTHPFASLVSVDDDGLPFVTHLPLHLQARADVAAPRVLLGHVARGNPHWRYLQARPRALVTFLGPHAYMSPAVYPDLERVPTWNYVAVHCSVDAVLIDAPDAKDALLKQLIADHEPAYAAQWKGLDAVYAHRMLSAIVAFELRVKVLECKVKINQHRTESHAAMHAAYAAGTPDMQALARWMETLGLVDNGPQGAA
ncbi:MAG TPA: FMN-binding negative transcriptional regulator [Burkholderiaceae bacterium]